MAPIRSRRVVSNIMERNKWEGPRARQRNNNYNNNDTTTATTTAASNYNDNTNTNTNSNIFVSMVWGGLFFSLTWVTWGRLWDTFWNSSAPFGGPREVLWVPVGVRFQNPAPKG